MQLLGAGFRRFVPAPAHVGCYGPMVPVHRVSHRAVVGVAVYVDLKVGGGLADAEVCAGRCCVRYAMVLAHDVKDSSSQQDFPYLRDHHFHGR